MALATDSRSSSSTPSSCERRKVQNDALSCFGGHATPAWRSMHAFTQLVQLEELCPRSQSVDMENRYGFSGGMSHSVSLTHSSTHGAMAAGSVCTVGP